MFHWARGAGYSIFRSIPIVGMLPEKCSKANLLDAFWETASFSFFATMPLWVLPLFSYWLFTSNKSIIDHTVNLASDGELFIYSAASLGPLFYIVMKTHGEWKSGTLHPLTIQFPAGASFLLFSLIVCIASGFFFGVVRIPELKSDSLPLDHAGTIRLSLIMFICALICLFCSSAYRNSIDEFMHTAKMNNDEEFSESWEAARNAEHTQSN